MPTHRPTVRPFLFYRARVAKGCYGDTRARKGESRSSREEKEDEEERGLAISREQRASAREDRWRGEPGNLGTVEFSRAKPPAATGRRDIHAAPGTRLRAIDQQRASHRRASLDSRGPQTRWPRKGCARAGGAPFAPVEISRIA